MTRTSPKTSSNSRTEFCARLRQHREERKLSLDDIAAETRIPRRSLESLESGEFEKLPADVFVRGFLGSYSRCVGLDCDDTLRRYSRLGLEAAPVASDMASEVLAQLEEVGSANEVASAEPQRRLARGTRAPGDDRGDKSDSPLRRGHEWLGRVAALRTEHRGPAASPERERRDVDAADSKQQTEPAPRPRVFLPRDFDLEQGDERRGGLTIAVIILVIVATITMSYLMRRPSHAGDGISLAPVASESEERV